ncbi:MAG: sigma 54-interacting transcriptional regulator [Peptococcaceae bacterium]|nr:sigma 54-interacting transcriptional regulator [Peptococcaceae bacterium]
MARTDSAPWLRQTLLTLLCAIDEGIHVVDDTGVTVYYNAQAAELEGLEPESVLGKHILDVYPSLDPENSTLLQVCRTKRPVLTQQQSFTNFKGQRVTTLNTTLPIIIDNRLVGAVEVSKNITAVRELSERLLDLQARVFDRNPDSTTSGRPIARYTFADIIGQNSKMVELKSLAQRSATTDSAVLVLGETGTGKELVVQAIHNASRRRARPFVAQNCAALPETLLESILFGTIRGSFTGAENRPGLFEIANGGTLFLDELNAMPPSLQAKLLRVLQDGMVRRIGDSKLRPVDVRIITAMNEKPFEAMRKGTLREDLYYRINVVTIGLPPLRERRDDSLLLSQHFISHYNRVFGRKVIGLAEKTWEVFKNYDWPGNVRELQHALEGAMNIIDGDIILPEHLPAHIREGNALGFAGLSVTGTDSFILSPGQSLHDALAEAEIRYVEQAMQQARGNVTLAAEILRIPRQTLQYKLRTRK